MTVNKHKVVDRMVLAVEVNSLLLNIWHIQSNTDKAGSGI